MISAEYVEQITERLAAVLVAIARQDEDDPLLDPVMECFTIIERAQEAAELADWKQQSTLGQLILMN